MSKIKLGVLGSTRGSSLQPVIDAIDSGELEATISVILSDKEDAGILSRGNGVPVARFVCAANSREEYDQKLSNIFKENNVDLILLVGYMKILSKQFVNQWQNKIINIHPSLLPKHAGLMNLNVHQAVLDAGDKETGCTVHYVDEGVDTGEIILQKKCCVEINDTAGSLRTKVQALEGLALIEVVGEIVVK